MGKQTGVGQGEGPGVRRQMRPGAGLSGGRLVALTLICVLVVVAGYAAWTLLSAKGSKPPAIGELTPEWMAFYAASRAHPEDLIAMNEERKKKGLKPYPFPNRKEYREAGYPIYEGKGNPFDGGANPFDKGP